MKIEVLYEDNHLIAVWKPAGILVQGDVTGDKSLMDYVKEYLKTTYNKQGNVFLGLVHRLDRPVSGIILFAKTSKGASRLSEQFREREVEKTYQALVEGVLRSSGRLEHYMAKQDVDNDRKNVRRALISNKPFPGSSEAYLSYTVNKNNSSIKATCVDIKLGTGRFHQIRAQFSHIGHPILGDVKYGSKNPMPDHSIALSAVALSFETATTGDEIELSHEPRFAHLMTGKV